MEPDNSTSKLLVLGEKEKLPPKVALLGNPNAGKTTLFNSLTGLRAKTANYPGTTVDYRLGTIKVDDQVVQLIDLPGAYSLDATSPEEEVTREYVQNGEADILVVVVDATHLERNLFLVSQAIEQDRQVIVALNMIDSASRQGLKIDVDQLKKDLNVPVVPVSGKTGENLDQLKTVVANYVRHGCQSAISQDVCGSCGGCQYAARYDWAEGITSRAVDRTNATGKLSRTTRSIDRVVTHPVIGLGIFALIGVVTFIMIFWLASFPMDWMDALFALSASTVGAWLPEGDFNSLVTDGIIGGVGGMLIFLPQITILFFMISLLEDSGYLARAAFVMDRLMNRVGLPGKAFVPMLSAHACAIPAIMASRIIDDKRDRLKTILILPLMTCSARLPVYAMVVAILFPERPVFAALTFAAAYSLGIIVALIIAFVFRLTILPGETRSLLIELPPYRFPSVQNAFLTSVDRAKVFVKKAGTIILVFSVGLWVLATYPKTDEDDLTPTQQQRLSEMRESDDSNDTAEADVYLASIESENSFAGRIGKTIQPVFAPLGYDWRLTVGVINSFAAREVVVSTLAVLYGSEEDDEERLIEVLKDAKTSDGQKVFTVPTCLSVLVFYIFAMQCLPTTAVVKRETGGWKWALFQIAYMTALAYVLALVTFQIATALTSSPVG